MKNFVISCLRFCESDNDLNAVFTDWNKTVKPNDAVYICGNFCVEPSLGLNIMKKLNGKKFFIIGEEDLFLKDVAKKENIEILNDIFVLDSHKVVLSYWALRNWKKRENGYLNIYGEDSGLIEPDIKTGSCAKSIKFGNKPIDLDFYISILNKKV